MNNWFDHIQFHLRTRAQRPAIVMEDRVVTYDMLRVAIERCARRVAALGVSGDAPVAILIENPIRHIAICLALFRIGIPSISIEHGQPGIGGVRFAAVLGDDKARSLVDPAGRFVEVTDDWFATDPVGVGDLPRGFADASQVCRIFLTSGTTGQPKFIKVTIREIGVRIGGFTGGNWSSMLCLPGLSSGWTFNAIGAALSAGQTLCFSVSPFQSVRMIELFSIDCLVASTEQLLALTHVARTSGAHLRSLRLVEVSGSVPTAVLLQAAMAYVCKDIFCRYGTTELGPVARAAGRDILSRPGLAGHLMPGAEIMIAGHEGRPCPPGDVGHVKGRPDRRWDGGSSTDWIDVGDLGWMSADGELYVLGRPSDTNAASLHAAEISPVHEVEHLLRLEWTATDAAAVLADGDEAASRPTIWVGTVDCKEADAQKLESMLRSRGLDFVVRLFGLKAIPRGANGKVQREQLKSLMRDAAGQAQGA